MPSIKKTDLHPEGDENTILYPTTSTDQIVGLSDYVQTYAPVGKDGAPGKDGSPGRGITGFSAGLPYSSPTGEDTITPVTTTYSDGTRSTLNVYAHNGENGKDGTNGENGKDGTNGENGKNGNGIISITTIGYTDGSGEYEGYTDTTIMVDTDDSNETLHVFAKNGSTEIENSRPIYFYNGNPEINSGEYVITDKNLLTPSDYNVGDNIITKNGVISIIKAIASDSITCTVTGTLESNSGGGVSNIQYVTINSHGVSGNITNEEYEILINNKENKIIKDGKIYTLVTDIPANPIGNEQYNYVMVDIAWGMTLISVITINSMTLSWTLSEWTPDSSGGGNFSSQYIDISENTIPTNITTIDSVEKLNDNLYMHYVSSSFEYDNKNITIIANATKSYDSQVDIFELAPITIDLSTPIYLSCGGVVEENMIPYPIVGISYPPIGNGIALTVWYLK